MRGCDRPIQPLRCGLLAKTTQTTRLCTTQQACKAVRYWQDGPGSYGHRRPASTTCPSFKIESASRNIEAEDDYSGINANRLSAVHHATARSTVCYRDGYSYYSGHVSDGLFCHSTLRSLFSHLSRTSSTSPTYASSDLGAFCVASRESC